MVLYSKTASPQLLEPAYAMPKDLRLIKLLPKQGRRDVGSMAEAQRSKDLSILRWLMDSRVGVENWQCFRVKLVRLIKEEKETWVLLLKM